MYSETKTPRCHQLGELEHCLVEEFFLDSVVSVFDWWARVYSNEFAHFGTCIFSVGQIEISKKSNSVRTRRLRSTKLSAIVRDGGPALLAPFGATPPARFAARGR